ncbi:MAG TPA: sorbitol-6-phosphate dehydrogenase [Candidatus Izemoplasmatales bacterium]|nr:sorbitol-6-phosphate dehydrogenase [Bacillota bacterium]HRY77641.1 sorbitol-6-phosphate dehydrogenase [Candidatus Izemoplasmatales bacterium]
MTTINLTGKIAVVTGVSQGLGEALAKRLDQEGCRIAACDINLEGVTKVCQNMNNAVPYGLDITNYEQCVQVAQTIKDRFGRVDILVCNAGILKSGDISSLSTQAFRQVIDVNLVGYFNTVKAFAPIILPQKQGSIIQINSKSGKVGSYKNGAYAASKFGGIGLTQSLALEFAEHHVRVNSICPGNLLNSPLWVNSLFKQYAQNQNTTEEAIREKYINQVPLRRSCEYEDIANMMVFLASDLSDYMTGQAINVTGGQVMH